MYLCNAAHQHHHVFLSAAVFSWFVKFSFPYSGDRDYRFYQSTREGECSRAAGTSPRGKQGVIVEAEHSQIDELAKALWEG